MEYSNLMLLNAVCISLLIIITCILAIGTKLKGMGGWAIIIIFIGTVPTHCYNLFRSCEMYDLATWFIYLSALNTLMMPLLYLFVHSQLDVLYRFRSIYLLHFIPTLIGYAILLGMYMPLPKEEQVQLLINENLGIRNLYLWVNDITVFSQMFVYFALIFRLIFRVKRRYADMISEKAQCHLKLLEHFMLICVTFFLLVFIGYSIEPRTDVWLIPILNIGLVAYLTYLCVANKTDVYYVAYKEVFMAEANACEDNLQTQKNNRLSESEMAANCTLIMEYLKSDHHYQKQDLSIWDISTALNIPPAIVSQSINGHFQHNFYDVVNRLRIEDVKRLFVEGKLKKVSVEAIAKECGFGSRSSFYTAFRKYEGCTPIQWTRKMSV